jgi:hypothetical protein
VVRPAVNHQSERSRPPIALATGLGDRLRSDDSALERRPNGDVDVTSSNRGAMFLSSPEIIVDLSV